jgi:hypothetical protein
LGIRQIFSEIVGQIADRPTISIAGTKEWWRDGKRHRDYGPAIEYANGSKFWYRDGLQHRDDGPATLMADGSKLWYRDGLLHRDDGPAIEWADGSKEWRRDDKLHRVDGPAAEFADGSVAWYRDGIKITGEAEIAAMTPKVSPLDLVIKSPVTLCAVQIFRGVKT